MPSINAEQNYYWGAGAHRNSMWRRSVYLGFREGYQYFEHTYAIRGPILHAVPDAEKKLMGKSHFNLDGKRTINLQLIWTDDPFPPMTPP